MGRDQLALHRRHPWLTVAARRPSTPGPNTLAYFDHCLRIMEPLQCCVTAKFEAIAMLAGVASLCAIAETASGTRSFDDVDLTGYPHLAAAFAEPARPDPAEDLFDRTLRALLNSLLGLDSD
jgi:hypothetical protein